LILEPKNTTDLLHHCACGQARRAFLQQDNELAEMRQRLQEHTHHLGGLKVRTNKSSDDVEGKRQQLCVKIRTLSVASKTLGTARNKLEEANKLLSAENGHGRLKNMEQKLRKRQQYMATQVAQIYPVRPLDEQSPGHKPGISTSIIKTSMSFSVLHLSWVFTSVFMLYNSMGNLFFFEKGDSQIITVVMGLSGHDLQLLTKKSHEVSIVKIMNIHSVVLSVPLCLAVIS